MSTLIVEVCRVDNIEPHPNADLLEILTIKGWKVVAKKGLVQTGDEVVYFPPDSLLTEELADRLGIKKYLQPVKQESQNVLYRVRATRLRDEPSYGTISHEVPEGYSVGDDLKDYFKVEKYEPPMKANQGDAAVPLTNFYGYTDIENLRNFPTAFAEGEEVVITEKAHGMNCRGSYLKVPDGDGILSFRYVAGSNTVRRKEYDPQGNFCQFWTPLKDEKMRNMLKWVSYTSNGADVIVYCELIGSGVQDMTYGHVNGEKSYLAFDISVNGKYLDYDNKMNIFKEWNIPTVPVLYFGEFSWNVVEKLTYGDTTICDPSEAGKFKGREGVVITPTTECLFNGKRKIFKSISADYLNRKGGTEYH